MIENKHIKVMLQYSGLLLQVELRNLGYLEISKSVTKLRELYMKN